MYSGTTVPKVKKKKNIYIYIYIYIYIFKKKKKKRRKKEEKKKKREKSVLRQVLPVELKVLPVQPARKQAVAKSYRYNLKFYL